jgi:hypothetical protein
MRVRKVRAGGPGSPGAGPPACLRLAVLAGQHADAVRPAFCPNPSPGPRTQPLLDILGAHPWGDGAAVDFNGPQGLRAKAPAALSAWRDTEQHCDYQYLVYTEGSTWSGRLPMLLMCSSVVFSHTPTWVAPARRSRRADACC